MSGFGLSSMRKTLTNWRESRGASTKMVRLQEHMACEGRIRELDSFSPERRRLKRTFLSLLGILPQLCANVYLL